MNWIELRELDKEIAIMQGHKLIDNPWELDDRSLEDIAHMRRYLKVKSIHNGIPMECPFYTSDMADAIHLMEDMAFLNPFLGFTAHHDRIWEYSWYEPGQDMSRVTASSPSMAVARGWLQWKVSSH